jgi:hypothetical protein
MTTPSADPDFSAWTQPQAAALRAKAAKTLDGDRQAAELGRLELKALGYVKHGHVPPPEDPP